MQSLFDFNTQPKESQHRPTAHAPAGVVEVLDIEGLAEDADVAVDAPTVVSAEILTPEGSGLDFSLTPEAAGGVYSRDAIIDEAFQWFRGRGFPYVTMPRFEMMQQVNRLALTPDHALRHTSEAYRVADVFHPHRFHATTNGKTSPLECFKTDDKFRHAIELVYDNGLKIPSTYFTQIGLSRGSQQCSQFRPGFACLLYRRFCSADATVLDTSTGYGGRLVGFVASLVKGAYIGIDPNTLTHAGNLQLADALGVGHRVELHNQAAEDVDVKVVAERCDFSFTSPPYFSKEHYSDEPTQSWVRYGHSFDAWVAGFLRPMLALTYAALKPGAHGIINIEDVTIKATRYPLVRATVESAIAVGLEHKGTELFEMQARFGANQDEDVATERVLIFRKAQ